MRETDTIVTQALSEALETMAFLTILPIDEGLLAPEEVILGEISFTGPKNGTVQILAGLDFAKILAENMGALDEVKDENAVDAIKEALSFAREDDVVIIAGKGHETYQEINGFKYHFDDREEVVNFFTEMGVSK